MEKTFKQFLGVVEDKNEEEGSFVVVVSTEDKDRDGEILRANGFGLKNYRDNPVVLWAHNYGAPPIGKSLWIKPVGDKLKAKIKFAPTDFAQDIKRLYEEKFLNAWSVGFIPEKWKDGDDVDEGIRREYTKQELLEFSGVPVPCNAFALTEAMKVVKSVEMKDALDKMLEEINKGLKPEETETTVRIPVEGEEGKHDGHKIRTISVSVKKGIKALYCVDCKKIITYLFDKSCKNKPNKCNWTMDEAKEWMKEHGKAMQEIVDTFGLEEDLGEMEDELEEKLEEKVKYKCECIKCGHKLVSEKHCKDIKCPECGGTMRREERPGPGQESVGSDKEKVKCQNCGALIDYEKEPEVAMGAIKCPKCSMVINQEGKVVKPEEEEGNRLLTISELLDKFAKKEIEKKEVLDKIEEALVNIVEKVGAVLSKKNKERLVTAKDNIQNVLDEAETGNEDDKATSMEDILNLLNELKESLKEKEKEEIVIEDEKEHDEIKEISGVKTQDVQAIVREIVGEHLSKHVREIREKVLGKVS